VSLDVRTGDEVTIRSRRGEMVATAWVVATIKTGHVFVPMHYEATNRLTLAHFDTHSRQPSYKDCAVRIDSAPSSSVDGLTRKGKGRKENR
jgi:assimilatory nitrate reductase catalytic subunit